MPENRKRMDCRTENEGFEAVFLIQESVKMLLHGLVRQTVVHTALIELGLSHRTMSATHPHRHRHTHRERERQREREKETERERERERTR